MPICIVVIAKFGYQIFLRKKVKKKMTEQVAGCIQIKFLYGESFSNKGLQENGDIEIVEIKTLTNGEDDGILVVYRSEE